MGKGAWVTVRGLKIATDLNGHFGTLVGANEANNDGRFQVAMHTNGHIDPDPGLAKLIKGEHIRRLLPEELQAVVRLNSDGEPGPKMLQLWIPKALSLCLQAPKAGQLSPVLAMCKQPVCIVQMRPVPVADVADLDNQWATYFMIDPLSGFAPAKWQARVGPVVLFRPGGMDISKKEVCCMHGFLDQLLDDFCEVAPKELTERFECFQTCFNEEHDDNGCFKGAWEEQEEEGERQQWQQGKEDSTTEEEREGTEIGEEDKFIEARPSACCGLRQNDEEYKGKGK